MPPEPPDIRNLANELAKERNRAAEERTLLAWIRTCLTLISFGFGIDQITNALDRAVGASQQTVRLSGLIGMLFIAVGVYAMLMAVLEHQRELRRIQRDDYLYTSRRSLSVTVAVLMMLIGAFAFVAILIRSLT